MGLLRGFVACFALICSTLVQIRANSTSPAECMIKVVRQTQSSKCDHHAADFLGRVANGSPIHVIHKLMRFSREHPVD